MVFAGYVILVISTFIIYSNWILGSVLILFALFISFSFSGIVIDSVNNRYKDYSVYFGIKTGRWQPLDKYIYLTVLCNNEMYETHSRANVTTSEAAKYFEVFMMDKTHRDKLLVKKFKNSESALKYANDISCVLNMELTGFHPALSEESIAKRDRR